MALRYYLPSKRFNDWALLLDGMMRMMRMLRLFCRSVQYVLTESCDR